MSTYYNSETQRYENYENAVIAALRAMDEALNPTGEYYDGIPVYIDNAYFPYRLTADVRTVEDIVEDTDWCIVGVFDTGDSTEKTFEYHTAPEATVDTEMRFFDDLEEACVGHSITSYEDGHSSVGTEYPNEYATTGRYILYSLYKPQAENLYMKVGDTYLFKGSNVT